MWAAASEAPAPVVAHEFGCRVTGIDLTEEFVRVARNLSRRVGLDESTRFACASATALPFLSGTFDGAYMIHIGMNIEDKLSLFREVYRTLRPGGWFAVYDVMGDGPVPFPVPWADRPGISFVAPLQVYREALRAAAFQPVAERVDFALEFFARAKASGLRPVMGRNAPQKVSNIAAAIEQDLVRPVEMILRKL